MFALAAFARHFGGEVLEHGRHLRLLRGLLVDPLAHDLLLGAHLAHELVDALGKLLDGLLRRRPARRPPSMRGAPREPLAEVGDGAVHVGDGRRRAGGWRIRRVCDAPGVSSVMPDSHSSS